MGWIEELCDLLDEAGLVVTFDRFRDNTNGCGIHCKAWCGSKAETYCSNHNDAISRGEYTPSS